MTFASDFCLDGRSFQNYTQIKEGVAYRSALSWLENEFIYSATITCFDQLMVVCDQMNWACKSTHLHILCMYTVRVVNLHPFPGLEHCYKTDSGNLFNVLYTAN